MMRLLHWVLAPRTVQPSAGGYVLSPDMFPSSWGAPPPTVSLCGDASFSVLYSDVGSEFYKLCGPTGGNDGWTVRDPIGTVWNVDTWRSKPSNVHFPIYDVEWLDEYRCKQLWVEDAKLLKHDLAKSTSSKTIFAFRPDNGVGAFQIRRTEFFLPGTNRAIPSKWGVRLSYKPVASVHSETELVQAFATWTVDIRPPPSTLIVTRLRSTPDHFLDLVECLITAAEEMSLERVEIWNLPKNLAALASELQGVTETRDEHLNAFKWYGDEKADDVEWMYNEK